MSPMERARPATRSSAHYTNLTVTNNLRPAGSASVLGTYFGEYNAARDMRIIQLAVKVYF